MGRWCIKLTISSGSAQDIREGFLAGEVNLIENHRAEACEVDFLLIHMEVSDFLDLLFGGAEMIFLNL
jgi:hypothetical protein